MRRLDMQNKHWYTLRQNLDHNFTILCVIYCQIWKYYTPPFAKRRTAKCVLKCKHQVFAVREHAQTTQAPRKHAEHSDLTHPLAKCWSIPHFPPPCLDWCSCIKMVGPSFSTTLEEKKWGLLDHFQYNLHYRWSRDLHLSTSPSFVQIRQMHICFKTTA